MIDPEESTMPSLTPPTRRAADEWGRDDDEGMAFYVLAYRRRARAAAAGTAACTAFACLLVALLLDSPWLAPASLAVGAAVYLLGVWSAERWLCIRLDASRVMISACIARFMADPDAAARAAMLKRGDAQVSLRR